jgi:hypothetical protein
MRITRLISLTVGMLALGNCPLPAQADTARTTKDTTRARALGTVKVTGRIDDLTGTASSASEVASGPSIFGSAR